MPDRARTLGARWLAAGAVALAVAACFRPALSNGFISVDDDVYVTANARVRQGLTWANAGWAATTFSGEFWHPVTWLSLLADATLQGTGPRGFHRTNVLLHAFNAALLCLLLTQLGADAFSAAALALLFALHPMRVESVAWVSERKGLLSAAFALAGLLAYTSKEGSQRSRLAWTTGFYFLSLAAKPITIALPLILLALDFWPLERLRRGRIAECLREKWPLAAAAAGFAVLTLRAQRGRLVARGFPALPARLVKGAVALCHYGAKTVLPPAFALGSPYTSLSLTAMPPAGIGLRAVLAVSGVFLAATAAARRSPAWLVGAAWFFLALVPTLGLIPFGPISAADRYSYFAHAGLAVLAGAALGRIKDERARLGVGAAALALAGVFAACLPDELATWRDTLTLCEYAVAQLPTAGTRNELGVALLESGQSRLAERQLWLASLENPDSAEIRNNLAVSLFSLGKRGQALRALDEAVALGSEPSIAHNRALVAAAKGGALRDRLTLITRH